MGLVVVVVVEVVVVEIDVGLVIEIIWVEAGAEVEIFAQVGQIGQSSQKKQEPIFATHASTASSANKYFFIIKIQNSAEMELLLLIRHFSELMATINKNKIAVGFLIFIPEKNN